MSVDTELREIAERQASRYPDSLIAAQGWTRAELVDAIHQHLRNSYARKRDSGQLERDEDGRIRFREPRQRSRRRGDRRRGGDAAAGSAVGCPTPRKLIFPTEASAELFLTHAAYEGRRYRPIRSYLCHCGSWHVTSRPERTVDREGGAS
ncbi:hypothetical protein B1R94_02205 [Mycolicibacterium litorale]|nr:hypothetical protein B1R94_02205 [Mycolicibacterium litorale]